jgi:hypothetical protein
MPTSRLLAVLLCAVPLGVVAAPWTKAGASKDSTLYLDKASIKRLDAGRRAWTLESFKKPQSAPDGRQYLSVRAQQLYDCEQRTVTLESQVFYPEPMGKGEIVGSYKYEAFDAEAVAPDSRYDGAFRQVCASRK